MEAKFVQGNIIDQRKASELLDYDRDFVQQELQKLNLPIDIENLRAITRSVMTEDNPLRVLVPDEDRFTSVWEEQERARALGIVNQLPARLELERMYGRSFALLMNITRYDYEPPIGVLAIDGGVEPEMLIGAAQAVWKFCSDAGLSPSLEGWDNLRKDLNAINLGTSLIVKLPREEVPARTEEEEFDLISSQMAIRCHLEANCGRSHAIVYSFTSDSVIPPEPKILKPEELTGAKKEIYDALVADGETIPEDFFIVHADYPDPKAITPEQLTGVPLRVFKYCEELGLQPDIQYWFGKNSSGNSVEGYIIATHWMTSTERRGVLKEVQAAEYTKPL